MAILFGGLVIGLSMGFPVPFVMLGASFLAGFLGVGTGFFSMMVLRVFETMHNYILVAIVLFVFMGIMLERSGAAERLFSSIHQLLGGLRGGLALAVVAVCTVMAAATGIMGAPVIIMGLFALPQMLAKDYDPGALLRHHLRRGHPGHPDTPVHHAHRLRPHGRGERGQAVHGRGDPGPAAGRALRPLHLGQVRPESGGRPSPAPGAAGPAPGQKAHDRPHLPAAHPGPDPGRAGNHLLRRGPAHRGRRGGRPGSAWAWPRPTESFPGPS